MHLVTTIAAAAFLVLPFTVEQQGILPPLPLGLFRFINPPTPGAPFPAVTTAVTSSAANIVSLDVVRSSHDATVVQDYSRRGCIGSVFNAPLGCPCADPGKRCYDPLSKCNLENRCVCDGTRGFTSADKTRCIAYATSTTRTTTKTTTSTRATTTPVPTTSTTTRTSTSTSTTTTQTTTTTKAFVLAAPTCKAIWSATFPVDSTSINICTTPTLKMPPGNGYVNLYVPNPMPKTPCTIQIDQDGDSLRREISEMYLPAGGSAASACSTGALQYGSSLQYCATNCPAKQFELFQEGTPIDHITFGVDPAAAATVDPTVTPFFLKIRVIRDD